MQIVTGSNRDLQGQRSLANGGSAWSWLIYEVPRTSEIDVSPSF